MHSQDAFLDLRKARPLSGVSLLTLVSLAILTSGAAAQDRFLFRDAPPFERVQGARHRLESPPRVARLSPRQTSRPVAKAGKPAPNQAEKTKPTPPPPGPHMLIVSVRSQKVSFYANGKLTSQSPVSTGTATHPTPHGVFSIIQRNRHHRSNIYSGAPMPYMQRLTWSGVALHQGALPGHPASHGCIRLPEQYANYLWNTIKMNTRVIVSRDDVEPVEITHALLFQPKPVGATVQTTPDLRKTFDTTTPVLVRTASMLPMATDGSNEAAKENAEATPQAEKSQPAMRDLSSSVERARSDAIAKPATAESSAQPQLAAPAQPEAPGKFGLAGQELQGQPKDTTNPDSTASIYPIATDIPNSIIASLAQSLDARQKKAAPSGNITVFISKKEKRLYVRQHFIPLFSAPVTFKDDKPSFGTHVFTALEKGGNENEVRWIAVSLPGEFPKADKVKTRIEFDRRGRPIEVPVVKTQARQEPQTNLTATAALDRILIAPDVVDRISEYVTAGASLIVSDHGLGGETGSYTDFIVVTR